MTNKSAILAVILAFCISTYIASYFMVIRPIDGITAVGSPVRQPNRPAPPSISYASANPTVNRICGIVYWPLIRLQQA